MVAAPVNSTSVLYCDKPGFAVACPSASISSFRICRGDVIIVAHLDVKNRYDLFNPSRSVLKRRVALQPTSWKRRMYNKVLCTIERFRGYFLKPPLNEYIFLVSTLEDPEAVIPPFANGVLVYREDRIKPDGKHLVLPVFMPAITPSMKSEERVGGIIGALRADSRIDKAVESALADGMDKVLIFGEILDPVYYYNNIRSLLHAHKGRIFYVGPVSRQAMYDSISDSYDYSHDRDWALSEKEAAEAGVTLHTTEKLTPTCGRLDKALSPLIAMEEHRRSNVFSLPQAPEYGSRDFVTDFYLLLDLLRRHIPFAFNRFSDGELFILQNKKLVLDEGVVIVGDNHSKGGYTPEDFKKFDPEEDGECRQRLMDAFTFEKERYFKGFSCRCCAGDNNFKWQMEMLGGDAYPYMTWANLFVNGNYPRTVREFYPLLFEYPVVMVCNESAVLSAMPFIMREYRVGYNAMINDYAVIEDIADWIRRNDITGYLFLFSASSFSKLAIYRLYDEFPKNTYFDIGTTLNCFMEMAINRGYLEAFWNNGVVGTIKRVCVW